MGYYDNVKENVKKESQDGSSGSSSGGGNFDTLKEAATETDPEEGGDDTPIEVLEEDGLDRNKQKKQSQSRSQESSGGKNSGNSSGNPLKSGQGSSNSGSTGSGSGSDADLSRIEEKMDTIIDQNQEMIEILRSFAE